MLSRGEVRELLQRLEGTPRVVGILLYGSDLRLLEALQLRVKDVDFAGGEIRVQRLRAKGAGRREGMEGGPAISASFRRLPQAPHP